jgi:DNA-binding transcriptional MerR regulator
VTQEGVLVMKILEAAKRAGLTVKTVRYYANIGMVTPHQDPATGYRDYSEEDVAKLQFVGKARRFDFSVEECRELLGLYEDRNRPSREVKALTLKKVAEIDARLNELQSLKDELSGPCQRLRRRPPPQLPNPGSAWHAGPSNAIIRHRLDRIIFNKNA